MNHKKGILYGVGVGPGDPELLTLKAVRILRECDVIGIPAKDKASCVSYQIACQAVPELEEKRVLALPVPMTGEKEKRKESYEKGAEQIIRLLEQGSSVALLNLGDPTVYGSYMRFHELVKAKGCCARIISGIPSFCAVAASLEIALGQEREAIHILPGCYRPEEAEKYQDTRVLMKSAGKLTQIRERLMELEKEGSVKAYAVSDCGMEKEAIYRNISELDENAGYFTTMILKENAADRQDG